MSTPSYGTTQYTPDRLVAGDKKLITREVTLVDNQSVGALSRGTLLAINNAGTEYAIVHQTGNHTEVNVRAILAEDADPSGGNVSALIYDEGEFNENELTLGGTVTLTASVREVLRGVGIHLKNPVDAA